MRTPEEIEDLLDKVEAIVGEYEKADDNFKRGEWSKKFDKKLSGFSDKLKKLNGDDFDIMKESYDEYHNDYSDLTDDEYTDALVRNIKATISRIWPDADTAEINEAIEEAKEQTEAEDEPKEVTVIETEDKSAADEDTEEGEPEAESSDEDDVESFEKELEDYKKSHRL